MISMPEELFQPHTHAKTCVVFLQKKKPKKNYSINMGTVNWCGHDSRGNQTIRHMPNGESILLDDMPTLSREFIKMKIWQNE